MNPETPRLTIRRIGILLFGGCLIAAFVLAVGFFATLLRARPEKASQTAAAVPLQSAPELLVEVDRNAGLTVHAERKRHEKGAAVYDGRVEIQIDRLRINCQHMERSETGPSGKFSLKGNGGVAVHGVPGFDRGITADNFFLPDDRSGLVLAGEVRLSAAAAVLKYRRCTVTMSGKITDAVSLLDDFARSEGVDRKLGLIDFIAAVYNDDELPPEACYLLAMKLLDRQLTWHSLYDPPKRLAAVTDFRGSAPKSIDPAQPGRGAKGTGTATFDPDPWYWSEAHQGEPWMHANQKSQEFWCFKARRHTDIVRAVQLLKRPASNAEEQQRRQHWLAEIARNNTVLTMDVRTSYRPDIPGPVVIDVRNADKLSLKLYRVTSSALWAEVGQRLGRDFIYWNNPVANSARPASGVAHRGLPNLDIEAMAYQWRVAVADLIALDLTPSDGRPVKLSAGLDQQARIRFERLYVPDRKQPSSWRCGRLLAIPAESLKKPGRYILTVEANGQTAYAPIAVEP